MKDEYDFTNAEQGKFFIPVDEIQIPVYLDQDILHFFTEKRAKSGERLEKLVNDMLRKDIELAELINLE